MRTTYGKQGSRGTGLHAGTSKLARHTSTSECALTSLENDYSLSLAQHHNQESSRVINNRRGPLKRAPHKAESGTRRMSTPSCKVAKVDSQSRQSRESISITVHCRLDETTPLVTLARQEVSAARCWTRVQRPTGAIVHQEFIYFSWTIYKAAIVMSWDFERSAKVTWQLLRHESSIFPH